MYIHVFVTWTDPFAPVTSRTRDLHVRECNLPKRKTDQNFRLWPPRRRRTRPSATRLPPAMEGQPPDDLDAPAMDVPLAQDVAEGAMGSALGALAEPIPSLAATDPGLAATDAMAMDCANPHRRSL